MDPFRISNAPYPSYDPENIPPLHLGYLGTSANPNILASYDSIGEYLNKTPYFTWPVQQPHVGVQIGQSAFVVPAYVANPATPPSPATVNLNLGLSPPNLGTVFNQQTTMMAWAFASSSGFQGLVPAYVVNPAPAPYPAAPSPSPAPAPALVILNLGLSPPNLGTVFNQQATMMAWAFASSSGFQGLVPAYVVNPAPAPYPAAPSPSPAPAPALVILNLGLSPLNSGTVFNQQAMMMAWAFASSSSWFQGPGRNTGPRNNAEQVINWPPEIVDESGLDLTLKL